jgi:hypothetical protein
MVGPPAQRAHHALPPWQAKSAEQRAAALEAGVGRVAHTADWASRQRFFSDRELRRWDRLVGWKARDAGAPGWDSASARRLPCPLLLPLLPPCTLRCAALQPAACQQLARIAWLPVAQRGWGLRGSTGAPPTPPHPTHTRPTRSPSFYVPWPRRCVVQGGAPSCWRVWAARSSW